MGRAMSPFVAAVPALLAAGLLVPAQPRPVAAQELGTRCDLTSFRILTSDEAVPGRRVTWVGRPDLICPDGTRIRADSAVVYQETGRNELIGSVRVTSPARELLADRADYYEGDARLFARGNVEFRDRTRGTEIRGDTLIYLEAGTVRPEEQLTVYGGRPSAVLPRVEAQPGAPDPDPYRVTADRLRFEGERFFWGDGDVEVERDDLRTWSDALAFDNQAGELILTGAARLEAREGEFEGERINLSLPDDELRSISIREDGRMLTGDQELFGEEIDVRFIQPGDRVQSIVARRDGRLVTRDLEIEGEEIRVAFEDERIQGVTALRREDPDDPDGARPPARILTEDFRLMGDSLEVVAPDEVLQTVYASGRARGETRGRGAPPLDLHLPDLDEETPVPGPEEEDPVEGEGIEDLVLDRDWIEGDVIVATFVPASPVGTAEGEEELPGPDPEAAPAATPSSATGEGEFRLERLVARGNARTLYRSPPDEARVPEEEEIRSDRDLWAISYILADEISIFLVDGSMERVQAEGSVRGVQLEPPRERRASANDAARREGRR